MNRLLTERNEAICALEREAMARLRRSGCDVSRRALYEILRAWPAPRFYVTHEQSCRQVARLLCGRELQRCYSPNMKACYHELAQRTRLLLERHRLMTLEEAVSRVIQQPAPSFYLSWRSFQEILNMR